jgi:hypothetical protein
VEYKAAGNMAMAVQMVPHFNIVNNSASAVALNSLSIRYYYTLEPNGSQSQNFFCDYAKINCSNVVGAFKTTSGVNADHYLELTFTGGLMIAANYSTG